MLHVPNPLLSPFIRAGLCCLFNSFICRNDCDYQSRAHRLTEEVKVAPQERSAAKDNIACGVACFLHACVEEQERGGESRKKGVFLQKRDVGGKGESVGFFEEETERGAGRKNICA